MRSAWNRWKFHLSGLVLLASVWYGPGYVSGAHWANMGERVLEPRPVGPYTVTLGEVRAIPPRLDPYGRWIKDYNLILSPAAAKATKAAYLKVGKPRNLKAAGAILHGNPYRLHAHVPFPATFGPEDQLWLTIETWTGEVHQVSWSLGEALATLPAPPIRTAAAR